MIKKVPSTHSTKKSDVGILLGYLINKLKSDHRHLALAPRVQRV